MAASVAGAQAGATISGTVTNESGVGLPGATVLIQGTTIGRAYIDPVPLSPCSLQG